MIPDVRDQLSQTAWMAVLAGHCPASGPGCRGYSGEGSGIATDATLTADAHYRGP